MEPSTRHAASQGAIQERMTAMHRRRRRGTQESSHERQGGRRRRWTACGAQLRHKATQGQPHLIQATPRQRHLWTATRPVMKTTYWSTSNNRTPRSPSSHKGDNSHRIMHGRTERNAGAASQQLQLRSRGCLLQMEFNRLQETGWWKDLRDHLSSSRIYVTRQSDQHGVRMDIFWQRHAYKDLGKNNILWRRLQQEGSR